MKKYIELWKNTFKQKEYWIGFLFFMLGDITKVALFYVICGSFFSQAVNNFYNDKKDL